MPGPADQGSLIIIGVVVLLVALVTGYVAVRLGQGGRGSRLLVTVVAIVTVLTHATAWFAAPSGQAAWQSLIPILIAATVLFLLWNARADAFFD